MKTNFLWDIDSIPEWLTRRQYINTFQKKFDRLYDRAIVQRQDFSRLLRVIDRARLNKKMTLGVIGGSITEGALATHPNFRWANLVANWLRQNLPTQVQLINAGIGSTGSLYGTHRIEADLLVHKPDLIIVEFGVNDKNEQLSAETLEGIVRQALKKDNMPAVLLLFMMKPDGDNAQEWQSKIGKHYKLPMVSYRDAIMPELERKKIKMKQVTPDGLHPNNLGHMLCSELIIRYFRDIYARYYWNIALPENEEMPPVLISNVFEFTRRFDADTYSPEIVEGWQRRESRWESDRPGSKWIGNIPGEAITIVFYKTHGNMGKIEAVIDQNDPVILDGWYRATWGGYSHAQLIASGLEAGHHRVEIKLLEDRSDESRGHHFEIIEILSAGQSLE